MERGPASDQGSRSAMSAAGRAVLIGGPTASGKSALALALADRLAPEIQSVLINADSMQLYRDLRILTARPGPEDEARVPHRLYGVLPAADGCSAMHWREFALAEIRAAWASRRLPIVVGGTGLYLRALLDGLAPVPPIPQAARAAARALHTEIGGAAMHARLAARDPATAGRVGPGDSQRLIRAWEVIEGTGITLSEWQRRPADGTFPGIWRGFVIDRPRAALYARIDARVEAMIAAGAVDEVRALTGLGPDPALPAMKAVGVAQLGAHLRGEIDLAQAVAETQKASRRLAKRQMTWFRHQAAGWQTVAAQDSESLEAEIFPKIRQFLLTGPG